MKNELKQLCALAVVRALPDMIKNSDTGMKTGRLKNRLERLSIESEKLLSRTLQPGEYETKMLVCKIQKWSDLTGWDLEQNEISVVVAFLIGVVADNLRNQNDKILSILEDIYNYFERAAVVSEEHNKEGTRAALIWSEVFDA